MNKHADTPGFLCATLLRQLHEAQGMTQERVGLRVKWGDEVAGGYL